MTNHLLYIISQNLNDMVFGKCLLFQPIGNIDYRNALIVILLVTSSGNYRFRISVFYLQKRWHFSLKSGGIGYVIRNLNINFFVSFDRNEIYFFFIQYTDVNFIASAKKLYRNNIFQHSSVIEVFRSEFGVTERVVAQVIFIVGRQILFAADIVSSDFVKCKGIEKVLNSIAYLFPKINIFCKLDNTLFVIVCYLNCLLCLCRQQKNFKMALWRVLDIYKRAASLCRRHLIHYRSRSNPRSEKQKEHLAVFFCFWREWIVRCRTVRL